MSDTQAAENNSQDATTAKDKTKQARSLTYFIFLAVFVLWIYSLWADRVTPMTDRGIVNAELIRITPQVSGSIAKVHVRNNTAVSKGQPLVTLDQEPYLLQMQAAQLALTEATQTYHAESAAIDVARANEGAARAAVLNAKQNAERYRVLLKKGTVSQAAMDDSLTKLHTAQANLAQAVSTLEKARYESGPRDENNPEIQAILNKREQAKLNLEYTQIVAPAHGIVTSMTLASGDYASSGKPMISLINNKRMWLTAMVRENSLAYLKAGVPVKIVLDAYPGQVLTGSIISIGIGSSGNAGLEVDPTTGLLDSPTATSNAQRFPVSIRFDALPEDVNLRYGGRAVVGFYPGQSSIAEKLASVWIWAWSYISYVA